MIRVFFLLIFICSNIAIAKEKADLESLGLDDMSVESENRSKPLLERILIKSVENKSRNDSKILKKDIDQNNPKFTDKIKSGFSRIGNFISDSSKDANKVVTKQIDKIDEGEIDNITQKVTNIFQEKKEEIYNNNDNKNTIYENDFIKNASNIITSNDNYIELSKQEDKYYFNKNYPIPTPKNPPDFLTTDIPPPLLAQGFSDENIHHPILTSYGNKVVMLFNEIGTNDINKFNALVREVHNVNVYNDFGDTPLIFAVSLKRRSIAASLIAAGSNPDLKNKLGQTAINIAIKMGDYEMVKILIDAGADLNIKDNFGESYLMQAVRIGYLPIIDYLADNRVDVNIINKKGQNVFDIARMTGNNVAMQLLLRYGSEKRMIVKRSIIDELNNKW